MRHLVFILISAAVMLPASAWSQRIWWAGLHGEIAETRGLTGWAYGLGAGLEWKRFYAGGFVMQTTALIREETPGNGYNLKLQFGGLTGAYHRPAIGPLEVLAGLRLGVGRVVRTWDTEPMPPVIDTDAVYLAIPFAGLELPLTAFAKVSLYSGYRFAGGLNRIAPWQSRDLAALANTLSIRWSFGK